MGGRREGCGWIGFGDGRHEQDKRRSGSKHPVCNAL